jgi:hypothetical protein
MVERRFGLPSATAKEQVQKQQVPAPTETVQPLPAGQAGRATAAEVGITDVDPLRFFVIGDHGGIMDPNPQNAVSNAMQAAVAAGQTPALVYSVGDWVYFNGDPADWPSQFYEPYGHLVVPMVGIPGNHDGDTSDNPSRLPLDGWMANLCSSSPALPAGAEEYNRDTQTQPWCDWTLQLQTVTVIGVYSNVPAGGHLEPTQVAWLTAELSAADTGKPVIVALHHPPYSCDQFHGGSASMGALLDGAFEASRRSPELVLTGHVHDYQRFSRTFNGQQIAYIVIGNSGYHNLHKLAADATPGTVLMPGVSFEYGDDSEWGYLSLVISGGKINGTYSGVAQDGSVTPNKDSFVAGH